MKRRLTEAAVAKIMEHLLERFGEPIGSAQGDRQGPPSKGGKKEDMGNRGFGAKFEVVGSCDQCGGMMGLDQCCTSCGAMPSDMMGPGTPKAPPSVPVEPKGAETAIVVVGGHANPRGTQPGASAKGVSPSVHPPQGMDGIPETGSGRGVPKRQAPAAAPVAEPKPLPATLDQCGMGMDEDQREELPKPPTSIAKHATPKAPPGGMDQAMNHEKMAEDLDEDDLNEKAPPGREKQVRTLKKKKGIDNPFAVAWASYNKSHGDE